MGLTSLPVLSNFISFLSERELVQLLAGILDHDEASSNPRVRPQQTLFAPDQDLPGCFSFTCRGHALIAQLHCTVSSQERAIASTSCCAGVEEGLAYVG